MKEEKDLLERFGRRNPFKVPDGYFENFTEDVMKQLPEKEYPAVGKITMWERVKPWLYMAAMFCGLMFGIHVLVHYNKTEQNTTNTDVFSELPDEYIDPIINQTLMDDYTLYQYLTDADFNSYH